ncbi:MAG: urease accessory protein UreD [Candidatus Nanopelagicales bacterium]
MRSRVEIVAELDRQGRTRLTRLWAKGALGVRRTGEAHVHLVGTAAGPIGDDTIDIDIEVGDGARLCVEGVAATIALPGAAAGIGALHQQLWLGESSTLQLALPALILTEGAVVQSRTEIAASSSAELVLIEQVSLGRFEEAGGRWAGRMLADVDGLPSLRQSQTSESILQALITAGRPSAGSGAIVSRLELGPQVDASAAVATAGNAINALLEHGGRLMTSIGASLAEAHRDLNGLMAPVVVAKAEFIV